MQNKGVNVLVFLHQVEVKTLKGVVEKLQTTHQKPEKQARHEKYAQNYRFATM